MLNFKDKSDMRYFLLFTIILSFFLGVPCDAYTQARGPKGRTSKQFNKASKQTARITGKFNRASKSRRITSAYNKGAKNRSISSRFNRASNSRRLTSKFNRSSKNRTFKKSFNQAARNRNLGSRSRNVGTRRISPKFNRVARGRTIKNRFNKLSRTGRVRASFNKASKLPLVRSVSDVMGKNYRAVGEKVVPANNKGLVKNLKITSPGKWVKVYEAGIRKGKKIEVHYHRNTRTGWHYNVKKAYDRWHQKEFKKLK